MPSPNKGSLTTPTAADAPALPLLTEQEQLRSRTKEELARLLTPFGYDSARTGRAGLRAVPTPEEAQEILLAIEANLTSHGVAWERRPSTGKSANPSLWQVSIIPALQESTRERRAPLNRLAAWIVKEDSDSRLFFDPMHLAASEALGALVSAGICLPLSLALDPTKLHHANDPTLGHELIHFSNFQYFFESSLSVTRVAMCFTEPTPQDGFVPADEFFAHRFSLKHALTRVLRIGTEVNLGSGESIYAQDALIQELRYLSELAESAKHLIRTFAAAIIDPLAKVNMRQTWVPELLKIELATDVNNQRERIIIFYPDSKSDLVFDDVAATMTLYMERLYSLSSLISETCAPLKPILCINIKLAALESGELIPSLIACAKAVLQIYKQGDICLDYLEMAPDPIFAELRRSLISSGEKEP